MKAKRFASKTPLFHAAFRLSEPERELWRAAAMKAGISLNDFVREAIKEKSIMILFPDANGAETELRVGKLFVSRKSYSEITVRENDGNHAAAGN